MLPLRLETFRHPRMLAGLHRKQAQELNREHTRLPVRQEFHRTL
jgi:hypothetical protein